MAKDEREFRHESLQDKNSIVAYLEAVAEGIRNGTLRFSDQDGEIVLEPKGLMNLEVRAKKRRDRVTLQLNCRWKQPETSDKQEGGDLKINGNGNARTGGSD